MNNRELSKRNKSKRRGLMKRIRILWKEGGWCRIMIMSSNRERSKRKRKKKKTDWVQH
jgi:hypothetical protein